jgi:hypothetical protein
MAVLMNCGGRWRQAAAEPQVGTVGTCCGRRSFSREASAKAGDLVHFVSLKERSH